MKRDDSGFTPKKMMILKIENERKNKVRGGL